MYGDLIDLVLELTFQLLMPSDKLSKVKISLGLTTPVSHLLAVGYPYL